MTESDPPTVNKKRLRTARRAPLPAHARAEAADRRFEALAELCADWYWEQDADARLIVFSSHAFAGQILIPEQCVGKRLWEIPRASGADGDWSALQAHVKARTPFRDVMLTLESAGETRHLSLSGRPLFDPAGAFEGYLGIVSDLTRNKRADQLLDLEHRVTRCLARAATESDGLKQAIGAICEAQGWDCGRYFGLDEPANVLRFVEAWSVPDPTLDQYIAWSRSLIITPGKGLAGEAWRSGTPHWISDLTRHASARAPELASHLGIRGSFVFPVVAEGAMTVGVLAFTSREVREPDERLLQAVGMIGSQIGQFLRRKHAEEVLRNSEDRFRSLADLSADWYWEQDGEARFTAFSSNAFANIPLRPEHCIGKRLWEIAALAPLDGDWQALQSLVGGRESFRDSVLKTEAAGETHYLSVSGRPLFDSHGAFKGYRGIAKDVTKAKRAEQVLELEHSITRCLSDAQTSSDGLEHALRAICEAQGWDCGRYWALDEKEQVLRVTGAWTVPNPALQRYIEWSQVLVLARGKGMAGKVWETGDPLWVPDLTKDPRTQNPGLVNDLGIRGSFFFPVTAQGRTVGVLGFNSREVREPDERLLRAVRVIGSQLGQFLQRKQAEDVLRDSEERFRSLTKLSSDWYWEQDENFRFTKSSQELLNKTGISVAEHLGKTRWELPVAHMSEADWAAHRAVLEAHQPFYDLELCRVGNDGNFYYCIISGEPMFDPSGTFKGYRGIGKDISARKRAEEELLRFRAAVDNSQDMVFLIDRATMRYVDVNSTVCRLLGYTREELLQMGPQDLVPVSEAALGVSHDALIANPGAHSGIRTDYRCKDGARLPFELTRRALRSGESHIIVVVARDIRERLAAEEALRQTNEALQRFRVAMDNSADMIVLVDRAAMRFVDVNSTVCNRLGYTREELLEIGPQDLLPASREELERAYDELLADPTVQSGMKSSYRCKDGTLLPFESTRRVVRSGDRWLIVSVSRDVSERIAAEEALRKSDERFNLAVRATNDTVWDWDLETDELWWNENLERVFGHPLAGLDPSAASWYELIHPEDQARVVTGIHRLIDSGGESWNGDYRFRRSDGSYASVHDRGHVIHNPAGRAVRMIGAIADVSVRKVAEETVRNQARQQRLIAEFGQQALASADLGEVLTHAVQLVSVALQVDRCSALELLPDQHTLIYKAATGWPSEWTGQRQVPLIEGRQAHYVMSRREPVVVADYASETRFELPPVFREGVRSGALIPIPGAKGMYGILCVNTVTPRDFGPDDVSFLQSVANILAVAIERKNAEDRLAHLAQFDIITGLPNRHLLRDRLAQTLSLARRNQWLIGVLFIDLDRFKAVNDTFGHSTGDKLLGQVAGRLKDCVRSADTVGRLSGDEFAVVLSNLTKADDAGIVAQKIVNALASPFTLDGHQTYISASIGIAIYPGDALEADGLLKNADTAMYRAKEQGRNSYQFFLPQMNERLMERLSREAHLRGALERGEFLLHYQPKVSLETGRISGFEALLRWNHGDELISPADFIPILEDTGLIVPVGEWVLRAVCEQLKSWQSQGISPRPVSVNLSARQFQHKGLLPMVKQALHDWDVPAHLLEFELTESLLMSDAEEAVQMLHQLKALGVRLSVDDFGTGYSSLSYLKRFPLDLLKIDRAFIRDAISDSDDATIIRTIISLAHSLGLQVVAEGVENEAQLRFLRAHGCDEMQGFYFARPMPPDACTRTLAEDRRLQAPAGMPDMECPSVLLVDDNEDDIFLLQRALLGEGYRITTAASPQAGFAALAQQRADIIISDHRMPGMSGVQFLNVVKKMYPDSVRIIATDTSDVGMLVDVVNNAAIHRFLSKGWDDERLRAEVRDAYQRRR